MRLRQVATLDPQSSFLELRVPRSTFYRNNGEANQREEEMRKSWEPYKVPILVSGVGLLLAIVLAVSPLMGSSSSEPMREAKASIAEQASELDQLRSKYSDDLDALTQKIAAQDRLISDLQNRISNLDRGVIRTFWRSKENSDALSAFDGANQRLSNLETQMSTLNRAVPRISQRVRGDRPDPRASG